MEDNVCIGTSQIAVFQITSSFVFAFFFCVYLFICLFVCLYFTIFLCPLRLSKGSWTQWLHAVWQHPLLPASGLRPAVPLWLASLRAATPGHRYGDHCQEVNTCHWFLRVHTFLRQIFVHIEGYLAFYPLEMLASHDLFWQTILFVLEGKPWLVKAFHLLRWGCLWCNM